MSTPLLRVTDLEVTYQTRRGLFGRQRQDVRAVNGVSFDVHQGETLGLVGESGSGKSTIGRALLRLKEISAGSMTLKGRDIAQLRGQVLDFRRDLQVVFQDPYSSLNPAMVIADIVGEPLTIHHGLKGEARKHRIAELLSQVGLAPYLMERYPSEFSGGQRQRIAIARALALSPEMIVCDEAVSALDVSTQSQVINLLAKLQADLGLAYLFIAHDLAVVRHISHRIGVLYLGKLMEIGPAERVYDEPSHPYTRMLVDAVPVTDPVIQKRRKAARQLIPAVELPGPLDVPAGCPFHTRCPEVMDHCRDVLPEPVTLAGSVTVACHLY